MNALTKLAQRFQPAGATASNGAIGVHFSRRELHLLQLKRTPESSLTVRAYTSVPFVGKRVDFVESRKAVRTLIKRARKSGAFRGRQAVSTLPFEHVKLLSVSYPAGPAEAEPTTILNLMADRLDGDLANYVIDYIPVRTSVRDGERLCLVAVCPKDRVIAYLDSLSYAGLQVDALEVAPLAIRRLVERLSSPTNIENALVINTGQETTYLTLISGRRLLSNQAVPFGERHLLDSICNSLDVPLEIATELLVNNGLGSNANAAADDLAIGDTLLEIVRPSFLRLVDEIERAFLYAASESYSQAAKRVYLFGALARWSGADQLLSSLTDVVVSPLDAALLPFDMEALSSRGCADLSVAAGLALWGLPADE